jgi:para-nitrobenzyl esterase
MRTTRNMGANMRRSVGDNGGVAEACNAHEPVHELADLGARCTYPAPAADPRMPQLTPGSSRPIVPVMASVDPSHEPHRDDDPVAPTTYGALRGKRTRHGAAFLGIPYAAPPTGPRRFKAPHPPAAWGDVRNARQFGPPAPQAPRALPGVDMRPLLGDGWDGLDVALTLNVWTPDPDAEGLPVVVFFHGGAFVAGTPAAPIYDGDRFARDGVVFVSVVYRLGIEGFLLLDGGDVNVGLLDQLAALRWVQEEIVGFGGDPDNVTAIGESAGAISLDLLLGTPLARGLFHRVVSQSGGTRLTLSREQGARIARAVADSLGVPPTREAFADIDFKETVAVQAAMQPGGVDLETAEDRDPAGGLTVVLPIRDGEVVAEYVLGNVSEGAGPEVALLVGDNLEEGNLYLAGMPGFDDLPEAFAHEIASRYHPAPEALLAAYREARPDATPGQLAAQVLTDAIFRVPTMRLADAHAARGGSSTFAYSFAWRSKAIGGRLGAGHGVELPFTFHTLDAPGLRGDTGLLGPDDPPQDLADVMHAAWVRFARTGDPGWEPYDPDVARAAMRFDTASRAIEDPWALQREIWDGLV